MLLSLRFFGRFSDVQSARDVEAPDDVETISTLTEWLSLEDPEFAAVAARPGNMVVVNGNVSKPDVALRSGDEVAYLSPLSGG